MQLFKLHDCMERVVNILYVQLSTSAQSLSLQYCIVLSFDFSEGILGSMSCDNQGNVYTGFSIVVPNLLANENETDVVLG